MSRSVLALSRLAVLAAGSLAALAALADAPPCSARSGPRVPAVVELYTSEGCSSCPPADRWLSALAREPGVVTLAFHVDYWDSLGWRDRFAQAGFSRRQVAQQAVNGARFAYTPQVVVDGRDSPGWPALDAARLGATAPAAPGASAAPPLSLLLSEHGASLELTVAGPGPATALAGPASGYLAVVDDGLASRVAAGENRGATLHHDAVVRALLPWTAAAGAARTLQFAKVEPPETGSARRYVAVALSPATGRPVQAVTLRCPS